MVADVNTGSRQARPHRRIWHAAVPVLGVICLLVSWNRDLPVGVLALLGVILALTILSAVHHAEVVAARVGEPYGSLLLAIAVTVIEVSLILTIMAAGSSSSASLARDTIFAALMITCNGMVGVALLVRTARGGEALFNAAGAVTGLSAIAVLATLSLILPNFTQSTSGPTFTSSQLVFAAIAALTVYLLYVFVQTVRHRDYFLPEDDDPTTDDDHVLPPTRMTTWASVLLLMFALLAVVGLAKVTSPLLEAAVFTVGLPSAAVAVGIASLVLLPESIAAIRAARRGRVQTSLNLAYGSAMASIGLTIPSVAALSLILGYELILGLDSVAIALLTITMFTGLATVLYGRATVLQGGIHLTLLGAFLVLVAVP